MIVPEGHVEPVPRRIRAFLGGQTVLDTTAARYVWEWPNYPQYYVPLDDVDAGRARRRGPRAPPPARQRPAHRPAGRRRTERRTPAGLRQRRAGRDASGFCGPRWTPGSRRTSRSSSTRATPTRGSTRCARPAGCGSSSTGSCSPSRPRRSWSSRPACRPATTSTAPPCDFAHLVPTRHRDRLPLQGRHQRLLVGRGSATSCTPTSPGPTTSRPGSCCRSPAWSPSTTRRSTSTSTASAWSAR